MEVKKASIAANTILKFPNEIATYQQGKDVVLVSPKDGNWLVLTESQLKIVERLRHGEAVGNVLSNAQNKNDALLLLKQILARDFTEKPLSVSDRTTKALFYLTYACNLQCEHCYMYGQQCKATTLSIEEYSDIFANLKENGVTEATFSSGEPLMRPDFWKIINAAHKSGLSCKIFSNGTLWSDSDIVKAKEYAIKAQISIDGIDEPSCAIVRGPHVFERAKTTVLKLANAGLEVEIATTPIAASIDAIERGYADFVRDLKEKSRNTIKFKVSQNLLPGRHISQLSQSQKQDYSQRGIHLYQIANPGGSQIPFFDEYRSGRGRIACGLGRLVFTPDGFVYICSRLNSFPMLGNARDLGVTGALAAAKERLAAASVDNTIPCRDCALRHICGGGCRAERFEYVSSSKQKLSIHKPCSDAYKMTLVKMMIQATKECYSW